MSEKEALKENIITVRVLFSLSIVALLSVIGWLFTHLKTIDSLELFLVSGGFVLTLILVGFFWNDPTQTCQ